MFRNPTFLASSAFVLLAFAQVANAQMPQMKTQASEPSANLSAFITAATPAYPRYALWSRPAPNPWPKIIKDAPPEEAYIHFNHGKMQIGEHVAVGKTSKLFRHQSDRMNINNGYGVSLVVP